MTFNQVELTRNHLDKKSSNVENNGSAWVSWTFNFSNGWKLIFVPCYNEALYWTWSRVSISFQDTCLWSQRYFNYDDLHFNCNRSWNKVWFFYVRTFNVAFVPIIIIGIVVKIWGSFLAISCFSSLIAILLKQIVPTQHTPLMLNQSACNSTLYGVETAAERYSWLGWLTFVLFTSLIGDTTILIASIKYNAFKLHDCMVVFIQHIAVGDLLITLFGVVPMIVVLIAKKWVFGHISVTWRCIFVR